MEMTMSGKGLKKAGKLKGILKNKDSMAIDGMNPAEKLKAKAKNKNPINKMKKK